MHQLRPYRLQSERGGKGLSCDEHGVALAGIALLVRTADGFVPRPIGALGALLKGAYGDSANAEHVRRGLAVAARALSSGDIELAKIATLHLQLRELDERSIEAANFELAKYSGDEPRDWHGRWTDGNSVVSASAARDRARATRPPGVISSTPELAVPDFAQQRAAEAASHGQSANATGPTSAPGMGASDATLLRPNKVHVDNPRFQSPDADTGNVPSVVREFVASGLASQIWHRGEGDGREISGDVQRQGDGFAVEDAQWGAEARSGVRIHVTADNTPAPPSQIPFYFHTHSDVPSAGAGEVYPGPSKADVDNSRNHGIWQVVLDKEGYVYVINPQGGLVRADGSVLPYEQAVKVRMIRVIGEPEESFPILEDHRNAFGHVRDVRRPSSH